MFLSVVGKVVEKLVRNGSQCCKYCSRTILQSVGINFSKSQERLAPVVDSNVIL